MAIISINSMVSAKYIKENEFEVANITIDRKEPEIEVIKINNNNKEYEKYANKTHEITVKIRVIEDNIKNVFFDKNHIKVKINNQELDFKKININKVEEKIYEMKLSKLDGNGKLKIEFLQGTIIDEGNLESKAKSIDLGITIDNIAPIGNFAETEISEGKVNGKIKLNEPIREINGWKASSDKTYIEKEFTNNVSYQMPIQDYAGNSSTVNISISKAQYIKLKYASHNSEVGWTVGYGNYDVAGAQAIKRNSILKTEAIAFNIEGNVDKDFLQANAYVYTHWGEGSQGKCEVPTMIYNHGYNPQKNKFKTMNSKDIVTIGENKYFQLGGPGVNFANNTDINGKNPIPANIANKYYYGVSGITLKLKDYTQFSVIYQILVDKVGWIAACSDGQECMYSKNKPMSAFRIAVIPKTEKQYIIDTWNKDIGTYNLK